jgi:hypothetical protein
MTRQRKRPGTSPTGTAAEAERRTRLAAALRENLLKRKTQKRGRDEAARQAEEGEPQAADSQPLEGGPQVK